MKRHWSVRMRDRLWFPDKLTGGGYDAETEAMLAEAIRILMEGEYWRQAGSLSSPLRALA